MANSYELLRWSCNGIKHYTASPLQLPTIDITRKVGECEPQKQASQDSPLLNLVHPSALKTKELINHLVLLLEIFLPLAEDLPRRGVSSALCFAAKVIIIWQGASHIITHNLLEPTVFIECQIKNIT